MSANSVFETDALNAIFSALSDPTRRAMLSRLSQSDASVNELAAPFKMSLPAISKHIKVLEKAGLLTKTINAQQRLCKMDAVQLNHAAGWVLQYATNNIANELINTPAIAQKTSKKHLKTEKTPKTVIKTAKTNAKTQEKHNDNSEPSDLQQQIGFDF